MTVLSAGEITLLRTTPHRTNLFLSIYKPATVFQATISDGSPEQGLVTLSYDNAIGTFSNAHEGMTVLIGTTPGGKDLGRLRFRSIVDLGGGTGTITVAENSVVWANGAFITIMAFYEPWAIYPRIIHNPSTDVPTVYKDYDIGYTNQNSVFDPIPMMGPHMAAILQSGIASLYFDGSASYDFSAGSLTFSWTFEGGTPSTSAVATPGNVIWNTPGHYVVTLHVANSVTGKDFVSHRHISIYDAIGGANPPMVNWSLQQLSGDFEAGGWNGRISLREDVDPSIVVDNAQVVIFADDWYGSTKQSIGGNYPNREKIVFVGYIRNGSIAIDPETNEVSFEVTTLDGRLQAEEVFAISVVAATAPANWFELLNPTVDLSVYHYLRWHSTVHGIADVRKIGDTLLLSQADFSHAFLFGSVDQFVQSTLVGKCAVDRQGQVWMQKRLEIVPVVSRAPGLIMLTSRLDWLNQLTIREQREQPVSLQEVGGVFYEGPTTGFSLSLISTAPGYVMGYEGNPQVINGMVLENQLVTNQLSGNVLAMRNKRFPEVHMPFIGNYRCVDIMPQERLLLTVATTETYLGLGIDWTEKAFIPRTISFQYDRANSILQVETTVTEESDGPPGVTGPYPQILPDEPEGVPVPTPPPDPGGTQPQATPETVYVACEGSLKRSKNFVTQTNPTWTSIKGSISGTISDFDRDPFSPTRRALCATTSGLWLTNSLNFTPPSWVLVYTAAQFTADTGATLTAIRNVRHTAAKKNCIYMQVVAANGHIFVGRTLNRCVTWTWDDLGVAGTMNTDEGLGFSVSHHTADKLWSAGGDGELYECTNGTGAFTFTLKYTAPLASTALTNIQVPYQVNPTDQIIYIAGSIAGSTTLTYTFDSDEEGWVHSVVSGSGSGAFDGGDGSPSAGCLGMTVGAGSEGQWRVDLPAGNFFGPNGEIRIYATSTPNDGAGVTVHYTDATETMWGGVGPTTGSWTQFLSGAAFGAGKEIEYIRIWSTTVGSVAFKFDTFEIDLTVASDQKFIYKTTDAGAAFSDVSPTEGGAIGKFGMASNDANNVYALVGQSPATLDLEKTGDGGTSWSNPQPGLSQPVGVAAWPYDDGIVLYLTSTTIRYSTNDGVTVADKTGNYTDYADPVVIDAEWAK